MRFTNGYVKLNRETFTKNFEGDGKLWATYSYLAMNINWSGETYIFTKMGKDYTVGKGEFYTTYEFLHQWLGFNFRTIKQHLERLKARELINLELKRNCMCIVFLQSECSGDYTTNEELKPKEVNIKKIPKGIQKESRITPPLNSHDSEGTPAIFENPPTEKKSKTPRKRKKAPPVLLTDRVGGFLLSDIKNAWNEHCGALPKIRGFNKKNTENLERCLLELALEGEEGLKYFSTAVENLGKADWVRGYKIDFKWFVRDCDHIQEAFGGYKPKFKSKRKGDVELSDVPGTPEFWRKNVGEIPPDYTDPVPRKDPEVYDKPDY